MQPDIVKSILLAINKVRADPRSFLPVLRKYKELFIEDTVTLSGFTFVTKEGTDAVDNAIEFLQKQRPVKTLILDEQLSKCADQNLQKSLTTEFSFNPMVNNVAKQLEDFCEWSGDLAVLFETNCLTSEDLLITLIVDDGLKNRPNRLCLFSTDIEFVGIAYNSQSLATEIIMVTSVRNYGAFYYDYSNLKYIYPESLDLSMKPKVLTDIQKVDADAPDDATDMYMFTLFKKKEAKVKKSIQKYFPTPKGVMITEIEEP